MDISLDADLMQPSHPETGLLSRTLSSSSTTKWIIPARIRNALRNDIVFVGDTSIQLREFVTTSKAHLVDVTGRFNFRTPILAARVITAKAELIDVADQVVRQTVEEERYIIGDEPLPEDHPPQILVLTLSSRELVFVYALDHHDGTVAFQCAHRPVLSGVDLPDKFGRHLAIDPESRALAFAPSMGSFAVASLRPVNEIKSAIDKWKLTSPKTFLPWTEQHFVQVDGYVVKMDFLQSPDDDPSKVILILLVANAGETSLLLYRWDTRAQLHHIKPMRCSGQVLPMEDGFPLLLVPCRGLASFFLVTETELVLYSQVTASEARRSAYPLPPTSSLDSRESSRSKQLLWTQWAKPRRHKQYNTTNDDVMLIREDGLLQYFMIMHKPTPRANISTSPGHLGFDVDTAFCMLPTPRIIGGGDILIVGGNMTDGGVFHLEPRQSPRQIHPLPNPAPFHDLLMHDSVKPHPTRLDRRCLYACCGSKDGRGGLVQIHHGLEAQTVWTMPHSDSASIEHIWTIEVSGRGILLFLFSHSVHSSLIMYRMSMAEFESADSETHPGIEFDSPTLAAARLGDDVFVQLTNKNINILSLSQRFPAISRHLGSVRPLCAEVLEKPCVIIAAHPAKDGFAISVIDLRNNTIDDDPFVPLANLQHRPVTMHTASLIGNPVVFIGTEQGRLVGFVIKDNLRLAKLFDQDLSAVDDSIQYSTVSSLCLLGYPSSTVSLLLCGLRNGCLLCIELKATMQETGYLQVDYQNSQLRKLGSTTVSVSPDHLPSRQDSIMAAFAVCQSNVKRIALRDNSAGADFSISPVFVADRGNTPSPFPTVNVAHRTQCLTTDPLNDINGLLVCATPDVVLFLSLVTQPGAILQRTPVHGIPKCLVRSPFLKQIVVGVDAPTGPQLVFFTSSSTDSDQTIYIPSQIFSIGNTTENIRAILNYKPTSGNEHFQYLVIALNSTRVDLRSGALVTTGNVVRLSLKRISKGNADSAKPRQVLKLPGNAITALSSCGKTSMLIGTEKDIRLHDFDFETRTWKKLSVYDLPSAAVSIDVRGGQIFVATQKHSVMQFKESQTKLVLVASDTQAKNTKQVLTFGGRKSLLLTSVSDIGTTVAGLAEDPLAGGLENIFEGTVPLILENLVEETKALPYDRERSSFIGSTADGTLYRFLTLTAGELELLKFLEELHQERKGGSKRRLATRTSRRIVAAGNLRTRTLNTHVDGDMLAAMVETGVMNLREFLEPRVKEENKDKEELRSRMERIEELRRVAEPLVGDTKDVVGTVIIWLRRILTWEVD